MAFRLFAQKLVQIDIKEKNKSSVLLAHIVVMISWNESYNWKGEEYCRLSNSAWLEIFAMYIN